MRPSTQFVVQPGGRLRGEARVPGDKSISHRSAILGAIAEGTTEIEGFLEGLDTLATLRAMAALGARVQGPEAGRATIDGVGLDGLQPAPGPLDLGNSGTAMRLLPGVLAGQPFSTTLVGDESLSARPMRRIADPLRAMGARVVTTEAGTPPLEVGGGGERLRPVDYRMPVASAQVKSCLLLAALHAPGLSRVTEPAPTRDHTERMLRGFGCQVLTDGPRIEMEGRQTLRATRVVVPADLSSAAFFMVGASIAPGSDVLLRGVGVNPTRAGLIDILRAMGAGIEVLEPREVAGEPVADLRITYRPLRGIDVDPDLVPLAIDEFPALFVAAACASGVTRVSGAAELRVKETDRIGVMEQGLRALGARVEATDDGMVVEGAGERTEALSGGTVHSHGDHRIAMAFAVAALRAAGPLRILDCDNVQTSFPGFEELARALGLSLRGEPGAESDGAGER